MNRIACVLLVPGMLLLGAGLAHAAKSDKAQRVYEYVTHLPAGSLEDASARLEAAAPAHGWEVLSDLPTGKSDGCPYHARVLSLYNPAWVQAYCDIDRQTLPFAATDRIALFEDENGVHVAMVNPRNIDRTVFMDAPAATQIAASRRHQLRKMIAGALGGSPDSTGFGQERDEGTIGKTMGVMAGGAFAQKIQDVATVAGANWQEVAGRLADSLSVKGKDWGLHQAYRLELPQYQMTVFGVTGDRLESRSFEIVGAGSEDARGKLRFPGSAHAAAYPLELVVRQDGATVKIQVVDPMFRMKMFFEDAGKMAFMKNMGMPGSIANEIKSRIKAAVREASF